MATPNHTQAKEMRGQMDTTLEFIFPQDHIQSQRRYICSSLPVEIIDTNETPLLRTVEIKIVNTFSSLLPPLSTPSLSLSTKQVMLTSKITFWWPQQWVQPKGLVLLVEEERLRTTGFSLGWLRCSSTSPHWKEEEEQRQSNQDKENKATENRLGKGQARRIL